MKFLLPVPAKICMLASAVDSKAILLAPAARNETNFFSSAALNKATSGVLNEAILFSSA